MALYRNSWEDHDRSSVSLPDLVLSFQGPWFTQNLRPLVIKNFITIVE